MPRPPHDPNSGNPKNTNNTSGGGSGSGGGGKNKGGSKGRRKPSAAALARTSRIGSKTHRQATRAVRAQGGLKKRGLDISRPSGKNAKSASVGAVSPPGTHGAVKKKPGEGQIAYGGQLYDRSTIGGLRAAMNARGQSMLDYFAKRPAAAARLGITAKDIKAIKTSNVQTTAARKSARAAAKKAGQKKRK